MESEKVKEIKKALEDNTTDHLPYIDGHKCKMMPYVDILTLINELESENERLKECYKVKAYDKLRAENKKLKNQIAELENKNEEKYKRIMELKQDLVHADENVFFRECNVALNEKKIKTEALEVFVQKIKEKLDISVVGYSTEEVVTNVNNTIDETLKEFMRND